MPRVSIGRDDVASLFRRLRQKLGEDQKQARQIRASGHGEELEERSGLPPLVVITFPVGWNTDGQALLFEAETVHPVGDMGTWSVRGKSERALIREMRWKVSEYFRTAEEVPPEEARARARSWSVTVADRLSRRPSKGEIITDLGV
jgi:hypothetical protein